MPAQLVALTYGPSILLDKPILLLGRHPECDIQIDSRKISRRHCCIAQVSHYLVVRDLDSTNGIRINGVRVTEGRLAPGDELTIGNHRYQVSWAPAEAAQPAPQDMAGPRLKETFRPPLPADEAADEVLESCDEPVPLAEPQAPEILRSPEVARRRTDLEPADPEEKPFLLPDHLELLPGSDAFPKLPGHSSGSHHPA